MLALSSLSKSTRYVAILFTGAIFFTEAIFGVLAVMTGSTRVAWVSIGGQSGHVTDAMFRQPPRYETPVIVSVLVLLGLLARVDLGARAARARRGDRGSERRRHLRPTTSRSGTARSSA